VNRSPLRALVTAGLLGAVLLLAGCGPARFEAQMDVPPPLIERIPVVAGVYLPQAFREQQYVEERYGTSYEISVGAAQSAGFLRLLNAMFERVVPMNGTDAASFTDPAARGVLEPVLEDFSFVTPRDAGTPFYAVSLRYRINLYSREGQLRESWTFTGYGSVQSRGLPTEGHEPLRAATALAMRDAGAKLAAEFHEQAIARGLLPPGGAIGEVPASRPVAAPAAAPPPQAAPDPQPAQSPAEPSSESSPSEPPRGG
jgi:hypothetical protein